MRPFRPAALALLAMALVFRPPAAGAQEMQFDQSQLVRSLLPMVVNITAAVPPDAPAAGAMQSAAAADAPQKRQLGSGFIIDPVGEIVTNTHVIAGSFEITVTFSNGAQAQAHVLAADRLSDIALLKVDPPHKLTAIRWGDSTKVQVGDPVLAIGNPLGVGLSVTGGIVSALNRDIMETPYDDYIQTDASINHGNSGGPLFDMKGLVVGINTAIISPTSGSAGVGFAIPARDAQFVIGQLQTYGSLRPGYLGLKVQQVTPDIADALGMKKPRGSIVAEVTPDGPAAMAGLRVGDIILAYNGVQSLDERALLRDIAGTPAGQAVTLSVDRAGVPTELHATVQGWPQALWAHLDQPVSQVKVQDVIPPDLGLKVAELPDAQRVKLGLNGEQRGVLVMSVASGTDAAHRGLKPGDAIERVQDQPIGTPSDFYTALSQARTRHRDFVLLLVMPQVHVYPGPEWMALRIGP